MRSYAELDPLSEYRTQLAFKDKSEHIIKVIISSLSYPTKSIHWYWNTKWFKRSCLCARYCKNYV